MSDTPVRRVVKQVAEAETKKQEPAAPPKYAVTEDILFEANENYNEAEDTFLQFVEKQMTRLKDGLLFDSNPSISQLNDALAHYESTLFSLLTIYASARIADATAKEKYEDAWAVAVMQAKIDVGLSKYVSVKDLEYMARCANMGKLSKLKADCIAAEHKLKLIDHLVRAWEGYQFVLSTMSKNAAIEVGATRTSNDDVVTDALGD
jgi:hypothetical protein